MAIKMDRLIKGIAAESKIRFTAVDVTVTAKALEARHLAGPTAGKVLAEGLGGVALLSMDAGSDDESVMLRLSVSGPIGGMMVEAMGDGSLRGFTNVKIMNELDGLEQIDSDKALGENGAVQIQTSIPGKILNQAALAVNPPKIKFILARYFNQSMQVPTACEINVRSDSGGIIAARGVLVQRMEDSDKAAFLRVLEHFDSGKVHDLMADDDAFENFEKLLELPGASVQNQRELMFRCRCSKAKMLAALKTMPVDELQAMKQERQEHQIVCHMCGDSYSVTQSDIDAVIAELRQDDKDSK